MVKDAITRGKKAMIVVRGRKLVDQASKRLAREGVDHGVLMAGHWNFRPHLPVQVCSIDTLIARGMKPQADLVIVDEAHLFGPDGKAADLLSQYDCYMVSVTATPYVDAGLRHLADAMVRPITMDELVSQGHLVPFRYFAPSEPDLRGVKINASTKDYNPEQLEERMTAGNLTGKIVDHWVKIAQGVPTICFAVNIHHSLILRDKFLSAGIPAEHCDADSSDAERNYAIKRLESGRTKIICNVGIMCVGVDIPSLGAIIMARATKSRNLYIQQAGRGTRTAPGKNHCILLDHAGNIRRHDFPTVEPDVDLDGRVKSESHKAESKICKECFAIYRGKLCPECGVAPAKEPPKPIEETNDELVEIKNDLPTFAATPEQWLIHFENLRVKTGRKQGWQFYKLLDKFEMKEVSHLLPAWFKKRLTMKAEENPFASSPYQGKSL